MRHLTISTIAQTTRRLLLTSTSTSVCVARSPAMSRRGLGFHQPFDPAVEAATRQEIDRATRKYLDLKGGANFVTGSPVQPFPLNPYFVAIPPVSNALRREIFELYESNPQEWSPRKLASRYNLSIVRVEAILKLKALEKERTRGQEIVRVKNETNGTAAEIAKVVGATEDYVQRVLNEYDTRGLYNFAVQEKFSQDMERALRVHERADYKEDLRLISSVRNRPAFRSLDEEESLLPEDAAAVLKLEPFAKIDAREEALSNRPFEIYQPEEGEGGTKASPPSPLTSRKVAFMFHDTGSKKTLVATRDGKVRPATTYEKTIKSSRK